MDPRASRRDLCDPGTRNAKHVADNLGAAVAPLPDEATRRKMAAHFNSL